ncbi:hypothetical protein GH733_005881 [Mirounga leonina]|nr:hypothetical protein GH733_005881 [Mirounga leonina]
MHMCDINHTARGGQKDAMKALKYILPLDMQNRILNFIKIWSPRFPGSMDVSEVKKCTLTFLRKVFNAEAESARQETARVSLTPIAPAPLLVIILQSSTITLVPNQTGQLHSELDTVKMNVRVLSTTLMQTHCIPGSENHEDKESLG